LKTTQKGKALLPEVKGKALLPECTNPHHHAERHYIHSSAGDGS
jgi:hypothetical protein